MSSDKLLDHTFGRGALFGFLVTMAADGVHWLITPMAHPEASTARFYAVVAQIVVCIAVAAWLYVRRPREQTA